MPFDWTLNPYRGCTHGCHYCFARRYHAQFELDADDEFASVILVKTNFVEVLARELDGRLDARAASRSARRPIRYQPIEGHYKLTRGAIVEAGRGDARRSASSPRGRWSCATPTSCCDADATAARARSTSACRRVDEDAWRTLEPGTAHPLQRLRAVRELVDAGINAGVLMAPIVPGFSSQPANARAHDQGDRRPRRRVRRRNVMYLKAARASTS